MKKIELMHYYFGRIESHLCAECDNLVCYRLNEKNVRKCVVYGRTGSNATDWAKRWTACGMFNKIYSGQPMMKMVKYERHSKPTEQVQGQIEMEE